MSGEKPALTPPQQKAAIETAGRSIALRSGAGCGKTFVLARRFTELLMRSDDANPLDKFVALTFTEKAALEMRQRTRKILSETAAAARGEDRVKMLTWLEEINQARISTIHGFCAALLRTHAVEAGVDPNFAVCADEMLLNQMAAEAAERTVLAAVEIAEADVATLLNDLTFETICDHVLTLIDRRTNWDAASYADPKATLARWEKLAEQSRREALANIRGDAALATRVRELAAIPCTDPDDIVAAWRDTQLDTIERLLRGGKNDDAELFAALAASPGRGGSPKAWGGKENLSAVRNGLKAVIARLQEAAPCFEPPGEADAIAAQALAALTRLAAEANALFASQKRRLGLLDFTDLLDHAARLLRMRGKQRPVLGPIEQLLVDEAQDIDSMQFAMFVELLAAQKGQGAGQLFLVGDGKQSIYRFRGAKVEVFQGACDKLGKGSQIDLDTSFRTHEAGVAFVNHLLGEMMGADYSPIRARRTQCPPGAAAEVLLARSPEGDIAGAAEAASLQAAVAAQRIRELIDSGEPTVWDAKENTWRAARYRDVAILFSRMTNSREFERHLDHWGIPYYVVAGSGFFQQQEVFDMLNVLGVIENPYDDLALAGVLRSSIFGLDDNALMRIAQTFSPPYFPPLAAAMRKNGSADAIGLADESQRQSLRLAMGLIGELHACKDALSIAEILRRVLEATGYEAVLLSQFQGKRMAGNVRRLMEKAQSAAAGIGLSAFVAQVRQQVMDESREEQAAVAGEEENVVRLMTIHKAKGLEFPIVIVPDLNASRRGGDKASILDRTDWGLTIKLKPPGADADDRESIAVSYRIASEKEDVDQRKEDLRRLYVAATRHQDRLILVGADWRTKSGDFQNGHCYLRQIDSVLCLREALDAGREELTFSWDGKAYPLAVRAVVPAPQPPSQKHQPPGRALLSRAASPEALARGLAELSHGAAAPPLLAAIPEESARVEIAVTALADFQHCPLMYHWRHELRVPLPESAATTGAAPAAGLDAATKGTFFHRCLELLDFDSPQSPRALAEQAAADAGLPEELDLSGLSDELASMLAKFRAQPLWNELAGARQRFRELDFVMDLPPLRLRGQIDLLYQDATGAWHIVDYKSDRLEGQDVAAHATRYELQMLLYAMAAQRHLGQWPAQARLYFLRNGSHHDFAVTPAALRDIGETVRSLGRQILAARRSGRFAPAGETPAGQLQCRHCRYHNLCMP